MLTVLILGAAPGIEVPVALTAVWCLVMLSSDPPPYGWRLLVFGGAMLGSTETLALPRSGLVILAMCAITLLTHRRRGRALATFVGCSAATIAEAVVRQDAGHAQILFATAAPIALAFAVGRRRILTFPAIFGALVLALATPRLAYQPLDLNPLTHAREASDQVQTVLSPGRTQFLAAVGLALTYRLQPSTLSLLRHHTVHVDPWEASLVWAYGLNWDPLPVFQDYSAYTATLDQVNADALRSSAGPQRILRENTALVDPAYPTATIDDRYPAWDPPEKTLAMLCNYVPLQTTARWQVLAKVPNRCGKPRLIRSLEGASGRTVQIPGSRGERNAVRKDQRSRCVGLRTSAHTALSGAVSLHHRQRTVDVSARSRDRS